MVKVYGSGGYTRTFKEEHIDWIVSEDGTLTVRMTENGLYGKDLATYRPGAWNYIIREPELGTE